MCHIPPAVTALKLCVCKSVFVGFLLVCVCVWFFDGVGWQCPGLRPEICHEGGSVFPLLYATVYVIVCLYIAATKYLYSHQEYLAVLLYAAFVSLALLLLALHFNSSVPPIKPSLELPFPDFVPQCPLRRTGFPFKPSITQSGLNMLLIKQWSPPLGDQFEGLARRKRSVSRSGTGPRLGTGTL